MSKKAFPTIPGLVAEGAEFMEEIQNETDRGVALAGGAFLDDCLQAVLVSFLVDDRAVVAELFGKYGPLSGFAARIDMAYCLGLITPVMREDLHRIRDMRNTFAHARRSMGFALPAVKGKIEALAAFNTLKPAMDHPERLDVRGRFIWALGVLASGIMMKATVIADRRGKDRVS